MPKPQKSTIRLDDPSLYFNRELSLLEFNERVLHLADDPTVPLLERLRFLTILSSNLDEFFEVRVAGVRERMKLEIAMRTPDMTTPLGLLQKINARVKRLVNRQYQLLNDNVLPMLREQGIRLLKRSEWDTQQKNWIETYFKNQVLPVLTPVGLDPSHPFPNVQNKSLNFIVSLNGQDAFGRETEVAILQVPRCLPRIIKLPETDNDQHNFVMISSVIHDNVHDLFPGMKVNDAYQFRVTRNSDMWVDEEEIDDLLTALKGELHGRNYGSSVRLEVASNCPQDMVDLLLDQHQLIENLDLYQVNGPVNLHRLGALVGLIDRPDLKYSPFTPGVPERLGPKNDLLSVLKHEDILLHHPFRSFNPVVDMLWIAAEDPSILAVKMTLYRVGKDSPIVSALIAAARSNKDVTVIVELRARFDEAANIGLAQKLTEAGAKVVYGIVNYKCHAKLLMLVRREGNTLRRYAHIGTGNYHIGNARLYTDYSFMTSNEDICEDMHYMFLQLTGLGEEPNLKKMLQSPFQLLPSLLELIDKEVAAVKAGKSGWIVAKMNSLSESKIIEALYRASQAGVSIDLIVRGICCLRPGIKGISENIRVHAIVGRFLEHHRCYAFCNLDDPKVFISSADWMYRNLHRRVESCCPITDVSLRDRILFELKEVFLRDNQQTWNMMPDGSYVKKTPSKGEDPFSCHRYFLRELATE